MPAQADIHQTYGTVPVYFMNNLVVYSLPNDKILEWSKLKASADDKINSAKMIIFVFNRVENIVEKGEKAGYQHIFHNVFKRLFTQGS